MEFRRGGGRFRFRPVLPQGRASSILNPMKIIWKLVGAVGVVYFILLAVSLISFGALIPADEGKQSRFLRTYDPIPFLSSFRLGCQTSSLVEASAGAGYRFLNVTTNVKFTRTIEPDLCDKDHSSSILTGLQQNLISSLSSAGCQVSSDWLSLDQGIKIYYRCGTQTSGLVTASPPKQAHNDRRFMLTLQIDEQWSVRSRT